MRQRHRSTSLDLSAEQRDDRTAGSKDISETGGDELGSAMRMGGGDDHFSDTLGGPHHTRRVDSLVRTDEDELLHAVCTG